MIAAKSVMGTVVRAGRPSDWTALAEMLERCSSQSRYQRFHGHVAELPSHVRGSLAGHRCWVAELPDGEALVGFADTGPVDGTRHSHEIGVLVEDAWQRRGIGGRLVRAVLRNAYASGVALVRLELCRAQPDLLAYVLGHLPVAAASGDGCDVTVDVDVAAIPEILRLSPVPGAPERSVADATRRPPCPAVAGPAAPAPA